MEDAWDDLRILLAVHRGRSFLAAGKALGVATSTVARRIEALEKGVGRPLVHRGNAGTVLDADALSLVALGEQMELGLDALRRSGDGERVEGTVRISSSEGFMRPLARVLARVQLKHPALRLEVVSESRMADLSRREADIGLRITKSSSASLIEKRLGRLRLAVFASRAYVARRLPGAQLPRAAAARHAWVGFDRSLERLPAEAWMRSYGATQFVLRSTSATALEEAVVSGMGLGVLVQAQAASLDLVRIETDETPPDIDVFLAFHREAKGSPRVRAVVRELEAELRRMLR